MVQFIGLVFCCVALFFAVKSNTEELPKGLTTLALGNYFLIIGLLLNLISYI